MKAQQEFVERAAAKDPDNPTLKFLRGQLAAQKGDYSTATEMLSKVCQAETIASKPCKPCSNRCSASVTPAAPWKFSAKPKNEDNRFVHSGFSFSIFWLAKRIGK